MNLEPTIEADFIFDEPFRLAAGEILPSLKQHYAVYGELNAERSNAVLIFHALSGSARAADWWSGIIGANQALDTNENAFICINYLGSCYGSTGANSVNPQTGEIYAADFPLVTVSDILQAQKKVLDYLGIEKLKVVIGSSVGGMCALQFAVDFPDAAEKCLVIGTTELSAMGLALNHLQREALKIENDVGLARQIAMISYKSPELFDERFGRNPNRNGENPLLGFEHRFDVAGYLDYQGEIFKSRFDKETFKIISKAMDVFELSDAQVQNIKAQVYLIGISSDWLFPAADVRKLTKRMDENGVRAEYINFESSGGHDAFLADTTKMCEILTKIQRDSEFGKSYSDQMKQINLFIAGIGTVGSKLTEQIRQQIDYLRENLRLDLRVIGIANSRKMIFDDEGIELEDVFALLPAAAPMNLPEFVEIIRRKNLRNSIFVDATASAEVAGVYATLLAENISVVACNKIACSSEYEEYLRLKHLERDCNSTFLFETSVGAGLPVINTLNDLLRSGDKINRIEAVLSGTLNFVFNNYDGTQSFASIVRQAQNAGYTEPDPRLDLSGIDVARKILILARESGYGLKFEDVENIPFLPEACFAGSVEDFYAEMERREKHFQELLENARSKNLSLKYIASFADGKAKVSLQEISDKHNFANLSGKDNAILYYTNRYPEQPLVIKGAGAGADVTAAGVIADIIRAARI